MSEFMKGYNSKPGVGIYYHVSGMENLDASLSETKKDIHGKDYRVLTIAGISVFLNEEQAIKIHEVLEKELYAETYKEIEDKYISEQMRADELEAKVKEVE